MRNCRKSGLLSPKALARLWTADWGGREGGKTGGTSKACSLSVCSLKTYLKKFHKQVRGGAPTLNGNLSARLHSLPGIHKELRPSPIWVGVQGTTG